MSEECRSCHAPIFWKKNVNTQKAAPLNLKPDPNGNLILVGEQEYAVVARADRESVLATGKDLYTSHYSNCPQAPTWKTGRKK
jgi:hypothetical protein